MLKSLRTHKPLFIVAAVFVFFMLMTGCSDTALPPTVGSVDISLTLSGNIEGEPYLKNISFSAETSTVEFEVDTSLEAIDIELAAELSGVSLAIGGQNLVVGTIVTINLVEGLNTIPIVVTPDVGDAVNYMLKITRTAPVAPVLSDDADLLTLELSDGHFEPAFSSSINQYSVSVSSITASVTLTPTSSDTGAKIIIGGAEVSSGVESAAIILTTGENTIAVVVTAEDGTTIKTYTITVTRRATVDVVSPIISLIGDNPMQVAFEGVFTDPGATVTDNLDGSWTVLSDDTVDTNTAGDYVLTYNAVDSDGNAATPVIRTVTVAPPPELSRVYLYTDYPTINDYATLDISASDFILSRQSGEAVFTAVIEEYDNDQNYLIHTVPSGYQRHDWVEIQPGEYTATFYQVQADIDSARTTMDGATDETWYTDIALTVPVLQLQGDASVTITVGSSFTDPGAFVKDWGITTDVYANVDLDGLDDVSAEEGTYTLTYSYTDTDGNDAAEVTRTVIVGSGTAEIIIQ
ncbi:MAG: DUF5011 domain-containing protein [Spirochaetales bacterium]|nr:DUF5011 domain-containing protein [Spirochaetales bacterium]